MKKVFKVNLVLLAIAFACLSIFARNAQKISKVEPPNWWANHSINPVRLLVRGENLNDAKVVSKDSSLKISNIRANSRGYYLFFDVDIARSAKVGKYEFEVSTSNGKTLIPFEISAPLDAKANFQNITYDDVIYLIMTDRFSNGDASNDAPKDSPKEANDRTNPRAWHGGDFRGIINHLDYLQELGITAIWLTPWYDNPNTVTNCDKPWCPNTNYHGYHAIDYYGVEDHFGTLADLRELVEKAHAKGIKVIQDQVANHVGIQHPWAKNAPLENWFSKFSPNTFNNSVLLSPNASPAEKDNLLKGWFNEQLPDMNQNEPEVARYEIQNALWWVGATGIDGIRQDTIQYMPREFIRDWSTAILKQYPRIYLVGEVFEEDSAQTAFFQGGKTNWDGVDTNLPSVFDFKLWRTSQEVFTGKKPVRALRDVLKYDGLYPNINRITTLQNNHDTKRFMSLDGATIEGAMLHTAFILATRGIPQLYYGEELAMKGGDDPFNRADFVGGWREDSVNKFTKMGRTAEEQKMFEWTRKWINLRRESLALKKGKTVDLFYDNDVYVFAREHQLADLVVWNLITFNRSETEKEVSFNSIFAKKLLGDKFKLKPLIGSNIKSDWQDNKIKIVLPPKSAIAFSIAP
ncbi:MAG: alpha-amylase family glycosyl hydrolase [Acidobacteriota bacterium]|nr:alpha-amylase family glycosyl hydrolase [Acidobacteriota bacterium]